MARQLQRTNFIGSPKAIVQFRVGSRKRPVPVLDATRAEDTKEVVTDGNPTYLRLIPGEKHSRGNHGKELAERVWTTTQTVENAFSLFKRAIVGNYHKLSPWHLDRYMREFCWRYNRRRMQASIFEIFLMGLPPLPPVRRS